MTDPGDIALAYLAAIVFAVLGVLMMLAPVDVVGPVVTGAAVVVLFVCCFGFLAIGGRGGPE